MDRFLDTYGHPKLNQEDINHLNRSVTQNKIEATIQYSKKKSPRPDELCAKFYQTFNEELIPTLLKLFYKIERERKLPNMKPILLSSKNHTKTPPKRRNIGQFP
jgi:hypothetical protein